MGFSNKVVFLIFLVSYFSCQAYYQKHLETKKNPVVVYVIGNHVPKTHIDRTGGKWNRKPVGREEIAGGKNTLGARLSKHVLTLYYEALCPDTVKFILEQLEPAVDLLHDYVHLKMVPFGKAHSLRGGESFVCQHGPAECLSNKIQDCVLYNMQSRADTDKVAYVACEMKTFAATRGSYECVEDPVSAKACVNSQLGTMLQLKSEAMTESVQLKFVPTITIDGVFNQREQDRAMTNLIGVLCQHLGNVPPCRNRRNESTIYNINF